jgi:hypothetical protein
MLKWSGNWSTPLYLMGGLFLVGALAWGFIDPKKRIYE